MWTELLTYFPLRVGSRVLRAKDSNAKANEKPRIRYEKYLNGNIGKHKEVIKALKTELDMRRHHNSLQFMQQLTTWVNQHTWEKYIGIDLSDKQIDANNKQLNIVSDKKYKPVWLVDDSENMDKHIPDGSVDFVFSCPPYHDLEVYTDDERDLSNMSYDAFLDKYSKIISKSYNKLKDNRFAAFVVTELRDYKTGGYKNFLSDTIRCFEDAGFIWYNDIVILQTTGTKALVAQKLWDNNRKITRRHQNFLVFLKGDGKLAKQDMTDIQKVDINKNTLERFF